MGIFGSVEEWIASVALKKGVVHMVQVVVAWIMAHGAVAFIAANGGTVADPATVQNYLTAALTGAIEVLRNFVKHRTGWAWL